LPGSVQNPHNAHAPRLGQPFRGRGWQMRHPQTCSCETRQQGSFFPGLLNQSQSFLQPR
jgi:hypothetical protein